MIPIWCCNYPTNVNPLHLIQKRIIRSVTKSDYLAHSKPLFKKNEALTIFDINKLYLIKRYFKNPEKYIEPRMFPHPHNTRSQNVLRPGQFATTLAMLSFLNQGPMIYNEIPNEIKKSTTVQSFKRKLRDHFLQSY